ncbi:DUF2157 domain-containing protein [Muricauda sp. CAU 1633]|uniref:DUF2157 domain-containing protein n=1 Tax=Allomuricauda sp. CAU 1633 TaxID=2816036 RepID=UPI001A8C0238|nr:DUF2157 domain-containing protein [Muricauda sp. CAU 1633]MBO0321029.1 DUF2157 domain-containing protein [Muricauda sp. CAU 1633]
MPKIDREDIQILCKHSNWSEPSVRNTLEETIYNGVSSWQRFLQLLLLALGVSFTAAGIIFFFAYNWADLHKFAKLGLIGFLIIVSILASVFTKTKPLVKKMMVLAASILVGVLYAVFGQVYQTGANAYDFFLGWTLFITIWVLFSNFAPLWTLFVVLLNTVLFLYAEQVAHEWSKILLYTLLFSMNALLLVAFLWLPRIFKLSPFPSWFVQLLSLATVACSTIGVSTGIFAEIETSFRILLVLTLLFYGAGIWYGLKTKSLFYLSIIAFSMIIILSAALLDFSEEASMLFAIGVFIVASITLLIKILLNYQKKWAN